MHQNIHANKIHDSKIQFSYPFKGKIISIYRKKHFMSENGRNLES